MSHHQTVNIGLTGNHVNRAWRILDWVAHLLYVPTMLGRRYARARWCHTIHLIPQPLLAAICRHGHVTRPGGHVDFFLNLARQSHGDTP